MRALTAASVLFLILAVLAINVSIPYLSWLLGLRFFGDDPGRNEQDWRRRFLKRALRGLLLSSHFLRGSLSKEENPFRKLDGHSNIFTAAVVSAVAGLLLLISIFNRLFNHV